ncbi:MAG: hypothetical protein Q9209_005723 [Squamulea sp. 1 TL-2023]
MTDRELFPDYFIEENIDRRKCSRVVPMKVLVIGMLRTGTLLDLPAAAFIPELHEAYPDAKVVIVQRDPDQWYKSCSRTVIPFTGSRQLKVLYFLDRWLVMRLAPFMDCLFTSLFGTKTKDPAKMRENWILGYMKAYEETRKVVPPEKRLEFSLEQGWEPLCKFLGKDVPHKPFPHLNDSAAFDMGIRVLLKRMWTRAARQNLPFLVAVLGMMAAWWMYR